MTEPSSRAERGWLFRVGSFDMHLSSPTRRHAEMIAESLGAPLFPLAALEGEPAAHFVLREQMRAGVGAASVHVPPDGIVLRSDGAAQYIHTELAAVTVRQGTEPLRIDVDLLEPDADEFTLQVHLSVILHKILFLTDRLLLHAAAARIDDAVTLFVGDKGAGKTTVSLAIARAGGTILAEDHVLVRRRSNGFLVSGCDQRARLTEKTERHFFREGVEGPIRELGGTKKRELSVSDHFDSEPFRDVRPARLCFLRVGERFAAEPLAAARALTALLDGTRKLQRFASGADQSRFLAFLADLAGALPAYDVELSDDLDELDRLIDFLRRAPDLEASRADDVEADVRAGEPA